MTTDVAVPPALFRAARWQRAAAALVLALTLLELAWELVLAPLRPGGSWLALKAVPLALLWPGLARGARRSRQIASLLLPLGFAEALVRALTEGGRHSLVAGAVAALALAAFAAILLSFRPPRR